MFKPHEIIESYQIKVEALPRDKIQAVNEIDSLKARLFEMQNAAIDLSNQLKQKDFTVKDMEKAFNLGFSISFDSWNNQAFKDWGKELESSEIFLAKRDEVLTKFLLERGK